MAFLQQERQMHDHNATFQHIHNVLKSGTDINMYSCGSVFLTGRKTKNKKTPVCYHTA